MADERVDGLGEQISGIVNKAIKEKNYSSLNETINRVLNDAIDSGSDALRSILDGTMVSGQYSGGSPAQRRTAQTSGAAGKTASGSRTVQKNTAAASAAAWTKSKPVTHYTSGYDPNAPQKKVLYASTTSPALKGGACVAVGGVLVFQALIRLLGFFAFGFSPFSLILGGIGAYLLYRGMSTTKKVGRFQKYKAVLGKKGYAEIKKLSDAVGKNQAFVSKDLKEMIRDGWFVEGHLDDTETTMMASEEVWEQYQNSRENMIRQQNEARLREKQEKEKAASRKVSAEAQEVLDKGNEYLVRIRQCNDAIPGEEISGKISRMELLIQRIFDRVRTNPEVIPDLKKLMNYYLPTTIKLLDAYADMDAQPVQGENISSAKKEIEDTLDTLNTAFEKILDSIFQDVAWDVSSDISVLNTMLAQEGLSGGQDFVPQKENAASASSSAGAGSTMQAATQSGTASQTTAAAQSGFMAQASAAAQAEEEKEEKITLTL